MQSMKASIRASKLTHDTIIHIVYTDPINNGRFTDSIIYKFSKALLAFLSYLHRCYLLSLFAFGSDFDFEFGPVSIPVPSPLFLDLYLLLIVIDYNDQANPAKLK
jgi:hypothetical protein